ncbi:hypothetical protein D1B31_20960 [Neobacillus notoginsengisoli]|uniref:Uncharacterized protein n=1 Tax=Neobacillus notoginsengisoli TaxID=1578198 RepID=A0A417YIL7_9BACI|nr:hypothetical protein [Neobacillus notoginsengisoli]RHW32820.1 hypothetical protein D1B31_20960 [Neobacillus notoginsengisoli]
MADYLSREVTTFINEHGDEVELDIFYYATHYEAIATICQDFPPFKDHIAFGTDPLSKKAAIQLAINNLNFLSYKEKPFH